MIEKEREREGEKGRVREVVKEREREKRGVERVRVEDGLRVPASVRGRRKK